MDNNTQFLTGDLGFGVLDRMREKIGPRFLNVGVAEQFMTGMAAGIALTGKKVFTYSIANFPTFRCAEQIRNDVCYHNLDVKIVSVGAGVAYGTHGYTHYGLEDLALMRSFKNIEVICPIDKEEAKAAAKYAMCKKGPMYIRLGKNKEPEIHKEELDFSIKKTFPEDELEKSDYAVITTGSIGFHGRVASMMLREKSYSVAHVSMPFVHPIDKTFIRENLATKKALFLV